MSVGEDREAGPAPSFTRINYAIRPAKATQRHMLLEAMGRLAAIHPLSDYCYVGFGSTFFVDFRLVHRAFGFKRMYSIERAIEARGRFELNRPFQAVELIFAEASEVLSDPDRLPWGHGPMVLWLDYDEPLDESMLADCERVLANAMHGSMLLVSFSSEGGLVAGRADRARERLGPWLAPTLEDPHLDDDTLREECFAILDQHAAETFEARGALRCFESLFRYAYSDGHAMATWGGVVVDADRRYELDRCGFDLLGHVAGRSGTTKSIEIPNLTPAEIAMIERHLPAHLGRARQRLRSHGIPEEEALRLADVYRYAPRFVETFA